MVGCHQKTGTRYDNQPTKFEVPDFARYGNMKGFAKCRKWANLEWTEVIQGH